MVADPTKLPWEELVRDFLLRMELSLLVGLLASQGADNEDAIALVEQYVSFSFS